MAKTTEDAWSRLWEAEPDLAADLAGRVCRGAALLDAVEPGWHARVAADRLAMESCGRCVLGQLHGDFRDGFRAVVGPPSSRNLVSASGYGFTLRDAEQRYGADGGAIPAEVLGRFAALADLWRAEIRARKGG